MIRFPSNPFYTDEYLTRRAGHVNPCDLPTPGDSLV